MKRIRNRWQVAVISLGAVLFVILLSSGRKDVPQVEICKASISDMTETIPCGGKLRPVEVISVSPDVSGEIVELLCHEGDSVCKGDVLLKIRQDSYLSVVEKAEAALGSLRAELSRESAAASQAGAALSRAELLYSQKAISKSELEAAQAEREMSESRLSAARWNVRSGEASLKEARENLARTVITAPMSGTVTGLCVSKGERVVGTSQMAGTEMLRIADFSNMEIVSDVGENDVVRICCGDSASITMDAYPGRYFSGRVSGIANSSRFVGAGIGQVANFEVRIAILPESFEGMTHNSKAPFKPGMSASVSIITQRRSGAVTLPVGCVFLRDGRETVWVANPEGTVTSREISTGIQDLGSIEITGGLSCEEAVVCGPYKAINGGLKDGTRVSVAKTDR